MNVHVGNLLLRRHCDLLIACCVLASRALGQRELDARNVDVFERRRLQRIEDVGQRLLDAVRGHKARLELAGHHHFRLAHLHLLDTRKFDVEPLFSAKADHNFVDVAFELFLLFTLVFAMLRLSFRLDGHGARVTSIRSVIWGK